MVHVLLIKQMEQLWHYFKLHVQIGLIQMGSKIIHFMVCMLNKKWRWSKLFILAYTSTNSSRIPIGFTTLTSIEIYLPMGDANNNYALQLTVEIRDIYGATTSFNFSMINVRLLISLGLVLIEKKIFFKGHTR